MRKFLETHSRAAQKVQRKHDAAEESLTSEKAAQEALEGGEKH